MFTTATKVYISKKYVELSENLSNLLNPAANDASTDDKRRTDRYGGTDGQTSLLLRPFSFVIHQTGLK